MSVPSRAAAILVLAGCIVLPGACSVSVQRAGAGDPELRHAEDAPFRFVTEDGTEPAPDDGCRVTMIDPRDQTPVRLVRSARMGAGYHGDYDVPPGRYGAQRDELLRLDCGTGELVGLVRS
jgi:hypothetical protein